MVGTITKIEVCDRCGFVRCYREGKNPLQSSKQVNEDCRHGHDWQETNVVDLLSLTIKRGRVNLEELLA